MRVLVINGFAIDDPDRHLVDVTRKTLVDRGHDPVMVDLVAEGFALAMSTAERAAYHEPENLITEETKRSADLVVEVDAMVFCYPTTTHTVPAIVKGWCERVLLPGVAFVFDDKGRVAPGMTNVVRLGMVTTNAPRPPKPVASPRPRISHDHAHTAVELSSEVSPNRGTNRPRGGAGVRCNRRGPGVQALVAAAAPIVAFAASPILRSTSARNARRAWRSSRSIL